jgi:hypothetical protein
MVVHRNPGLSWEIVEHNWRRLATVQSATWITTYYNVDEGLRYCVWYSQDKTSLEKIFSDLEISFESMVEVQETKPDMWGKKWQEHLEADAVADTLAV